MSDAFLTRLEGPSPAAQVARDLVRRGLWIAPLLMLGGAAIWGTEGFFSVGYGIALILVNFALSAFLIASTSRISLSLMMAAVLFGFLIRLAIIFAAVWLVKDASWMHMVALGVTIIVTHLGLLFWELRYVSASLAYPGLKPGQGGLEPGRAIRTSLGPEAPSGSTTEPPENPTEITENKEPSQS